MLWVLTEINYFSRNNSHLEQIYLSIYLFARYLSVYQSSLDLSSSLSPNYLPHLHNVSINWQFYLSIYLGLHLSFIHPSTSSPMCLSAPLSVSIDRHACLSLYLAPFPAVQPATYMFIIPTPRKNLTDAVKH